MDAGHAIVAPIRMHFNGGTWATRARAGGLACGWQIRKAAKSPPCIPILWAITTAVASSVPGAVAFRTGFAAGGSGERGAMCTIGYMKVSRNWPHLGVIYCRNAKFLDNWT